MPETDNEVKNPLPIDPPDNQGGGAAVATIDGDALNAEAATIDPPDNQGGGNT